MDTFTQAVEGWHDFYLMFGTAPATVIGLLLVSLSLHVDLVNHKANAYLRVLAACLRKSAFYVTILPRNLIPQFKLIFIQENSP